jgi:hypothetical protein
MAQQQYSLDFEDPQWFICDHALQIVNLHDPMESPPEDSGDWPPLGTGEQARRALEEVMESILVLNLPGLLRERVEFLYRAGDTWGIEDITGLDNLGRFHLFELKRDGLSKKVTEQLATYLLGNLFKSGDEYMDDRWSLHQQLLTVGRWALYLAAALANTRTSNLGYREVNQWHPAILSGADPPFTKSRWDRLSHDTSYEGLYKWGTEAMVAKATATRGVTGIDATMVYEWAAGIKERLGRSKPERPRVRPEGQVVIWLVGRSFNEAVFDRVRLWRRAGIDARCLLMEARQSLRTGQWVVRVQREKFPEREQALDAIARMQAAIEADPGAKDLVLEFYETRAPSNTDLSSGGMPLREKTKVVLRDQAGKQQVIFRASASGA